MYCKICKEWQTTKHHSKDENGNRTRLCVKTKTFVPANQLSCELFETAITIWCSVFACFMSTQVCVASLLKNNHLECKECKIGLFILRKRRINGKKILVKH